MHSIGCVEAMAQTPLSIDGNPADAETLVIPTHVYGGTPNSSETRVLGANLPGPHPMTAAGDRP